MAEPSDYHLLDSQGNEALQVVIGESVRFQLRLKNNGTSVAPELAIAFILAPKTGRFVDHQGGVESSRYGYKGIAPFNPPAPGETLAYVASWKTSDPFFVASGVNWFVDPGKYEVLANWVPENWDFPNASDFQGWVTRPDEVEFVAPPVEQLPGWAVVLISTLLVAIPTAYVLIRRWTRPRPRRGRISKKPKSEKRATGKRGRQRD